MKYHNSFRSTGKAKNCVENLRKTRGLVAEIRKLGNSHAVYIRTAEITDLVTKFKNLK